MSALLERQAQSPFKTPSSLPNAPFGREGLRLRLATSTDGKGGPCDPARDRNAQSRHSDARQINKLLDETCTLAQMCVQRCAVCAADHRRRNGEHCVEIRSAPGSVCALSMLHMPALQKLPAAKLFCAGRRSKCACLVSPYYSNSIFDMMQLQCMHMHVSIDH